MALIFKKLTAPNPTTTKTKLSSLLPAGTNICQLVIQPNNDPASPNAGLVFVGDSTIANDGSSGVGLNATTAMLLGPFDNNLINTNEIYIMFDTLNDFCFIYMVQR